MKRSEFIEIVKQRANEELYGRRITSDEGLSGLIQIMEEEGMLPPNRNNKDPYKGTKFAKKIAHAWEPEDE